MIPSIRDHIVVHWATLYYCGLLLEAGVEVYVYEGGFMHAKTITVDGEICSVGSANFDIRSFRLNFETNAILFDVGITKELDAAFEKDMENSMRLEKEAYAERSLFTRFRENLARLVSDVL
jgi:cardiolipin synthase